MRSDPHVLADRPTAAAGILPSVLVTTAAALAALCAAGCDDADGPQRVLAFGTVKVDEARLPAGTIVLVPVEGTPGPRASGTIIDGEFDVPASAGPVPGVYRVEITADSPDAPPADAELAPDELDRLRANPPARPRPLPTVYNAASTLRREIVGGEANRLDFDLTRTPKTAALAR